MHIRSLLSMYNRSIFAFNLNFSNRKLDRAAEAAQREEIKALLQTKKESTKKYEESLRKYSTSNDSTAVECVISLLFLPQR